MLIEIEPKLISFAALLCNVLSLLIVAFLAFFESIAKVNKQDKKISVVKDALWISLAQKEESFAH